MDLKERVTDREIYNSEETIILNNPPKPNGKTCVEVMVDFVNHFFNAKIARASLEACHFLNKIVESANTMKFLYFGQRKLYLEEKKMLKSVSRTADGESFCIVERLLQVARDIFQQCRAMGPETVTNIAEVQAICKNETGVTIFWPIRSTKDLDSLKDVAIMFDMGHGSLGEIQYLRSTNK